MKPKTPKLTHERLLEVLFYNVITGEFTWRIMLSPKGPVGSVAGSPVGDGYLRIMIDGERLFAHRLAWFWVHGEWPKEQIDHRSVNSRDNALLELREATPSQNQANRGLTKSNTSGFKGITYSKAASRWQASIRVNGKLKHLGQFDTKEEAAAVYAAEAEKIFGEFARLR